MVYEHVAPLVFTTWMCIYCTLNASHGLVWHYLFLSDIIVHQNIYFHTYLPSFTWSLDTVELRLRDSPILLTQTLFIILVVHTAPLHHNTLPMKTIQKLHSYHWFFLPWHLETDLTFTSQLEPKITLRVAIIVTSHPSPVPLLQ